MELVIVVSGVLIALWLQQSGEHRRAVRDMRAAEDAIHQEVRANLTSLLWREAISQCHFDRALLLKSMLMNSGDHWPGLDDNALIRNTISQATGIATAIPSVYQRPADNFSMAAWNSALATGVLAPMDKHRFAQLAGLYEQVRFLLDNAERENQAAATLSALSLSQQLTADSKTRMLEALYQVDTSRFMFNLAAIELPESMQQVGWADRSEIDQWIRDDEAADRGRDIKWRPCVKRPKNPFAASPTKG